MDLSFKCSLYQCVLPYSSFRVIILLCFAALMILIKKVSGISVDFISLVTLQAKTCITMSMWRSNW